MHTVKGWHDKSQSGIYANEVKSIGQEQIEVKSFKGGVLAKGIYKDIKEIIGNVGGHYSKSIYIMTPDGEIYNLSFKGSCVQEWGDFTNKCKTRLADEWISIGASDSRQKGKVKYSVPVFTFAKSLTDKESQLADQVYEELERKLSNRGKEVASNIEDESELLTDEEVDF
jgi:hypothetical protein